MIAAGKGRSGSFFVAIIYLFHQRTDPSERQWQSQAPASLTKCPHQIKTDLSAQFLSQVESGKKKISLQALFNVSQLLYTKVDDLLEGNFYNGDEAYIREISKLLEDCSEIELKILYEMIVSLKKVIHENVNNFDKGKNR